MADWTESMQQTFEYYIVDPGTWKDKKRIRNVKSCTINRDSEAETLGSATIDIEETLGECYIRVYLITIQNGVTEKHPLGTFLVQTPGTDFDGKRQNVSMDAYTPLLELKESPPPLGSYIPKGENVMESAYDLVNEHARAPVVKADDSTTLQYNFVSNTEDTWLSYASDLISNVNYIFGLDELGRILFLPKQNTASLQPVWTYDDSNSSILYPEITVNRDLYGIPNVVEVIYSKGGDNYYAGDLIRAVNNDDNSPISVKNRGREIIHRVVDPDIVISTDINLAKYQMQEYADTLLKELSVLEYTLSYTHGYCPVRLNDCVRLNYARAGLNGVKAKVISQSIKCTPGCPVTEKAVFTTKLWG